MKLSHSRHVPILLTFSNEQQSTSTAGIHACVIVLLGFLSISVHHCQTVVHTVVTQHCVHTTDFVGMTEMCRCCLSASHAYRRLQGACTGYCYFLVPSMLWLCDCPVQVE